MHLKTYLVPILCLFISTAHAEFRDPGEMNQEEYQQLRQKAVQHRDCMNEYAMSQLSKNNDPRVVADHAMKHCAPVLEELHDKIISWHYPPEFGKYYVSGVSNRNANQLLGQLMRYMAMPRQ